MIGSANDEVPIQLHLNEQTAPAVVDRALSNDFDEEDIGFRRPDASKRSPAVEARIRCLCPSGANDELELIGRLAADLGELTAPISHD